MNGLIEIGDKVVLYGFFVGFAHKTDGTTNGLVTLKTGERVEIPLEGIMKKDQIITKKDVISRMKQLFPNNRIDWINGILHEFGDEFGLWKYKAGYEQGKLEGAIKREKVVVPQFVADYIKYAIENDWDFQDLFKHIEDEEDEELLRWVYHERNQETLAAAWINGYTVEKEKRYIVKMSATKQPLFYNNMYEKTFFSLGDLATRFTRKQLEGLGLG